MPNVPQTLKDSLPADHMQDAWLRSVLEEDIGRGDITSLLTVPAQVRGTGKFLAKSPLVLAGAAVSTRVFELLDPSVKVELSRHDGESLRAGETFGTVTGPARVLLTGERVALNLLQHLSGIATLTRAFVDAVAGTGARILDTRKTIPGLRMLEKNAVRTGGGHNHRFGLDDGILIKDNHIALAGGLEAAITAARDNRPNLLKIEVEVSSSAEAERAILAGADMLLLDNMTPDSLRETVRLVAKRVPLEASGGVNLDTVRAIAESGVDFISIGKLTHSATAVDINLKFHAL
jgi:nicotinate-nucleotide pyrophosphorylase (carboxylating)